MHGLVGKSSGNLYLGDFEVNLGGKLNKNKGLFHLVCWGSFSLLNLFEGVANLSTLPQAVQPARLAPGSNALILVCSFLLFAIFHAAELSTRYAFNFIAIRHGAKNPLHLIAVTNVCDFSRPRDSWGALQLLQNRHDTSDHSGNGCRFE